MVADAATIVSNSMLTMNAETQKKYTNINRLL